MPYKSKQLRHFFFNKFSVQKQLSLTEFKSQLSRKIKNVERQLEDSGGAHQKMFLADGGRQMRDRVHN
jgi:hypothetical protein